jgi:hypothetical protein
VIKVSGSVYDKFSTKAEAMKAFEDAVDDGLVEYL